MTIPATSSADSEGAPGRLMQAHRYREALALYDARRSRLGPCDWVEIAERAVALWCLGRLGEALEEFTRANGLAKHPSARRTDPYLEEIGALRWILGERAEAVRVFRAAVDGVLSRRINYGDMAGGVGPGLLLWYAGVSTGDEAERKHAREYLANRALRPAIRYWPGPLALFALGRKTLDEVLDGHWATIRLETIVEGSRTDLLKRRQIAQTLFYAGTKRREEHNERDWLAMMRRCAALDNPIVEVEWYLSVSEVGG